MLISVRLYVQGNDLDPGKVTDLLGAEPARSHQRGESRVTAGGKKYEERIGVWIWKKSLDSPEAKLDDCIEFLNEKFGRNAAQLLEMPGVQSAWVDVHIVQETQENQADSSVSFDLSRQNVQRLASLGLPVEFTVSVGGVAIAS
jgi:hypothetical protein